MFFEITEVLVRSHMMGTEKMHKWNFILPRLTSNSDEGVGGFSGRQCVHGRFLVQHSVRCMVWKHERCSDPQRVRGVRARPHIAGRDWTEATQCPLDFMSAKGEGGPDEARFLQAAAPFDECGQGGCGATIKTL